jgi:hypothetical protein
MTGLPARLSACGILGLEQPPRTKRRYLCRKGMSRCIQVISTAYRYRVWARAAAAAAGVNIVSLLRCQRIVAQHRLLLAGVPGPSKHAPESTRTHTVLLFPLAGHAPPAWLIPRRVHHRCLFSTLSCPAGLFNHGRGGGGSRYSGRGGTAVTARVPGVSGDVAAPVDAPGRE